jgi:hypothetical protein
MGNYLINNVSVNCMEDTKVVEVNKATVAKTLLSDVNPLDDMDVVMITDDNATNTVISEYNPLQDMEVVVVHNCKKFVTTGTKT